MKSNGLGWAGLALMVSAWGCGGSSHEQGDPSNQGGAPGAGVGGGPVVAGSAGTVFLDGGSAGISQGGEPPISNGGSAGAQPGGSSGAQPGGSSSAGAPPVGNCDYLNEVTITSQYDADRVAGCATLSGVYVADVAEPLVIDWPLLTTLNGELHFAHDAKLTRISLPNLRQLNGELYLKGNAALKTVEIPSLVKISGDPDLNSAILVQDNPKLTTFVVSADLRMRGLTQFSDNPLLCDAATLFTLFQAGALYPGEVYFPDCAYPGNGAAGAGGNADF